MSRCFPFPPPGYERKHKPEDLIVLKEAKQKEKRQKKEKRDREKRKDRDKKEKDGSGEKHRDKKDRKEKNREKKEKHREKKKDENLGKDKEKSSILEESTIAGKLEARSGEKLQHPGGRGSNERSPMDEEECSTLSRSQNGAKPFDKILASQATTEAKFVQELGRRIREDEKISGNQFPESVSRVKERDQEEAERMAVGNPSVVLAGEKGDSRHKGVGFKNDVLLRSELIQKPTAQNLARAAEIKVGGIPGPVEEQNAWRLDHKEKSNGIGDDRGGEKLETRDNKIHRKDKDKRNDMKKEEKSKKKTQKTEHEKSKKLGTNDPVGATGNENRNLFLNVETATPVEVNIRKRKDRDANGFLHESEIRPNTIQWHTLHQATENGRELEAAQISSKFSSDTHAFPNNFQLDHRDRLTNGIVEAQKATPSKPNHSIAPVANHSIAPVASYQIGVAPKSRRRDSTNANKELAVPKVEDLLAEASMRPPHPDSMHLSQVLKVPSVGDWPEYDDQEWLFSKKDPPEKKPISELASVTGEQHVWSKAMHIESADVYAMPYVIPY